MCCCNTISPQFARHGLVEKTIGDRDYKLYYDGDRLRMVAWQTDQGSFWISNSLIETVSNEDMLKIAVGFRQLPGT